MPILLELFLTFLKIGAVSFGGGYGMIPLLSEEVISKGWLTSEQLMDFIAVSESTPGPVAINMATFIGASEGGFFGAFLATLGVILPSFIIILLIASVISGLLKFAGVKSFLRGVRPVAVGLIVSTGLLMGISLIFGYSKVGDNVSFDWRALVIFSFVALFSLVYKKVRKKSVSAILLILISAGLGIVLYGALGFI